MNSPVDLASDTCTNSASCGGGSGGGGGGGGGWRWRRCSRGAEQTGGGGRAGAQRTGVRAGQRCTSCSPRARGRCRTCVCWSAGRSVAAGPGPPPALECDSVAGLSCAPAVRVAPRQGLFFDDAAAPAPGEAPQSPRAPSPSAPRPGCAQSHGGCEAGRQTGAEFSCRWAVRPRHGAAPVEWGNRRHAHHPMYALTRWHKPR